MNRSGRKRRNSCVDDEVCANSVISKRKKLKKLLTRPSSLEIGRYRKLRKSTLPVDQALVLKLPTRWTLRKPKRRGSEVSRGVAERSERVYFLTGAETRVGTLGICVSGAR
jgi:hypothetical protein